MCAKRNLLSRRDFLQISAATGASLLVGVCLASCGEKAPAVLAEPTQPPVPAVRIHYLGHACFLLQFGNGVSVLTDYGQSNSYGLDSPIHDLTGVEPDILTFSHDHDDHRRTEVEFDDERILTGMEEYSVEGLEITPIPTFEKTPYATDNTSYLFTYQGMKILHLADAQALIGAIDRDEIRQTVIETYPDTYDVLLMTIEGVTKMIPDAETFIDSLQPVRVIPMHYWSPEYKADFLDYLETQNQAAGRQYQVQRGEGADYALYVDEEINPIQVISLEPAGL